MGRSPSGDDSPVADDDVPGLSRGTGPSLGDDVIALAARFADQARGLAPIDQLVAARVLIEQLEARWLVAAADVEASGAVTESGSGSLGSWMQRDCLMAPAEASARSRVAHAITSGELPQTGPAMLSGKVTWRQAQVIGQAVRQVPSDRAAEAESTLVQGASSFDPGQLRRLGDRLLHCFDREAAEAAAVRRYERRGFTLSETIDGMFSVSGLLDPITGSLVMTALDARLRPPTAGDESGLRRDGSGRSDSGASGSSSSSGSLGDEGSTASVDLRTWSQRRADALGEICSEWLGSVNQSTVAGVRPHLSVIVDAASLAARSGESAPAGELAWAGPVTASETQLIGCDATVSRIVMDGPSMVLDVGRATRTIPPALRRAVVARDRTCVAPGCHRPPEHCDVHHVVFWEHGGSTSLDNTVLVCRRHHRMVHQLGFRVVVDRTGRRTLAPPG